MTSSLDFVALYATSAIGIFGGAETVTYAVTKDLFPLRITMFDTSTVNVFPFINGAALQMIMGYLVNLIGKSGGVYPAEAYALASKFYFIAAFLSFICLLFIKETLNS